MTTVAAGPTRQRILDAALVLMSEHGASGTSMRQLAVACDLNVATLYHHFPSKSDLFRAVVAEQGYLERMGTDEPPPELADLASPGARLSGLVSWLWGEVVAEEAVWRLLIGEAMRGDATARDEARVLVEGMDLALAGWVAQLVPEVADRAEPVARLVRATLFNLMVGHLALGPDPERASSDINGLVKALHP
jgi:AcrR family transcriptional regulator